MGLNSRDASRARIHVYMSAPLSVGIPILRSLRLHCAVGARYCGAMATGGNVDVGVELTKNTEEHGMSDVPENKTTEKEAKPQVLTIVAGIPWGVCAAQQCRRRALDRSAC